MRFKGKKCTDGFMSLDMTCIGLSVGDLLRCSYGLSKREAAVLLRMLEGGGWMSVSRIAMLSRRDRSVVQRALARLESRGAVEREQHNRDRGGYEYLYRARGKAAMKRTIREKSRNFCRMVEGVVASW
jgi:predicted transcriptional regulator